jgi:hypothetical protein
MAKLSVCDVCRKPTNRIVYKLLMTSYETGSWAHSNYIAHADVGECCASTMGQKIRFHRRKKRANKNGVVQEVKVA